MAMVTANPLLRSRTFTLVLEQKKVSAYGNYEITLGTLYVAEFHAVLLVIYLHFGIIKR